MRVAAFVSALLCGALTLGIPVAGSATEQDEAAAETFVRLTLRLGATTGHEEEVDFYFGPEALRPHDTGNLAQLKADSDTLLSRVKLEDPTPRGSRLLVQIRSFDNLLEVIGARAESFEDEAQRLYARSVPSPEPGAAHQLIAALEAALPGGTGPLAQRLTEFYRDFVVPPDRRRMVFERALRECRSRTLAHWQLPRAEKLDVEWTDSVPAAWHRYRRSVSRGISRSPRPISASGPESPTRGLASGGSGRVAAVSRLSAA
jgi:hypothetical protein